MVAKKKDEKKQMAARLAHEERMALPLAKLAGVREARGWSKAKSADAAGMDPTTYSRIERCVVNPFPAQAEAIANAFGVSVDDLAAPAPEAVAAEETEPTLPESVDPIVELGLRVKTLEDDLTATMASLGTLKARHKLLVARVKQMGAKATEACEELAEAGSAPTPVWVTVNVFGGNDGGDRE